MRVREGACTCVSGGSQLKKTPREPNIYVACLLLHVHACVMSVVCAERECVCFCIVHILITNHTEATHCEARTFGRT